MGGATFSDYKTYIAGETLTASDLNSSHMNILNNFNFAGMDDYSATATEMRTVTDPYPAGVESLATSGQGEIERLRYLLKLISGEAQWYIDPDNSLLNTSSPTYAGMTLAGLLLTGALNEAYATVASHATTAPIWVALGNLINYTGTAVATAFPNAPQAGARRTLICAAACGFTAGANMLINGKASGSTYTAAAGDRVEVEALSTTQFKLTITKYDGTAVTSSGADISTTSSQKITATGTFTPAAGITKIFITAVAAGGGGGASVAAVGKGGSAGGAGEWCVKKQITVVPATEYAVTLGAIGTGSGSNNGTDAADTTFGALFTLDGGHGGVKGGGNVGWGGAGNGAFPGGSGGLGAQGSGASAGGAGAAGGGFANGDAGTSNVGVLGLLGFFGQGGSSPDVTAVGGAGKGYGSGGAGGSGGDVAGGNGAPAIVIVEW